jgi:hypothetical protein
MFTDLFLLIYFYLSIYTREAQYRVWPFAIKRLEIHGMGHPVVDVKTAAR